MARFSDTSGTMTPAATSEPAPGDGATALTARDGLRYGLLGFPLAFCALPLYVLMPNWYAREWGVSLAALGAVLLAVRAFDAVLDPWLGRWVDRLFARSLRAVWVFGAVACAVLALGFCMLWMPLVRGHTALLWWAGACLLVTYVGYSALTVAHQSWGAMLGGDACRRSHIVAWREGLGVLGVVLAAVTPTFLGVPAMLCLLVASLVLGWWAWVHAPRPTPALVPHPVALSTWGPWRNPAFCRLVAVYLLNGIASAIPATLVLFFVQDRLQGSAALQSASLGLYFVSGAVSIPLWLRLVARVGLHRAWLTGMVLSIAVFAGASQLGEGDGALFLLVCAFSGLALGSDLSVPGALLAGVVAQSGERGRSDGTYWGWWNFATKLTLALSAGLALPMLGWMGYEPGSRSATALQALTLAYCLLPCVVKFLAALALYVSFIQSTAPEGGFLEGPTP